MANQTLQIKNYTLTSIPRRILVIAMRYLGDVLLTTPLLHSIRKAYPDCQLDVLALKSSAAMLEGNPHINQVITLPAHTHFSDNITLIKRIFRRYDLAFVTETGDRRYIYGLLAAPIRIAFAPAKHEKGHWKRLLAQGWIEDDSRHSHRVLEFLRLGSLVNIPPVYSLTLPTPVSEQDKDVATTLSLPEKFAVLHMFPQWNYKRWTQTNWITTGKYLREKGLKLVLSGGPASEEKEYIDEIDQQLPEDTINLAGRISLAQLAEVISHAQLFIGPDTGTTHLAAATGIPVIAIYGPTNPVRWAPWPINYQQASNPFQSKGSQRVNNVFLIQGEADCVPCGFEGCDRHRKSYSQCLEILHADRVIQAIDEILIVDD